MRKIIFASIIFILSLVNTFASLQDDIIPTETTAIVDNTVNLDWNAIFIVEYVKKSIFGLLALIAIWVFIFIWARLVMARWNPEEFKKALMQFIYAIVWLALVAIAWAAVKLISSLNF